MVQVVEADRGKVGGGDQALEEVGDLAGVEPGAVLLDEDAPGQPPGGAPPGALAACRSLRSRR